MSATEFCKEKQRKTCDRLGSIQVSIIRNVWADNTHKEILIVLNDISFAYLTTYPQMRSAFRHRQMTVIADHIICGFPFTRAPILRIWCTGPNGTPGCYITFWGHLPGLDASVFSKRENLLARKKISLARKKIYGLEYIPALKIFFFSHGGSFSNPQ